jgi:tryptophan-rich sensory protein
MRNGRSAAVLILWLAVCLGVGSAGAVFTARSVDTWYPPLVKPPWNPPGWVFGPVWTTLYVMMALAAWLVWRRRGFRGAAAAFRWFALQLALNALWSPLFFGLQNPRAALVDVVLLWAAIAGTVIAFWKRSRPAGILLLPYWLWVSFAAALNFAIWRLNP